MSAVPLPGLDQPDLNEGPRILGAVVLTTTCALVVVCARLYVRLCMTRSIGTDDYVMIAAMLLSLGGMGVVIASVRYGAGRHAAYLNPDVNRLGLKLNFVSQPIYLWAIPLVKVSVGFFLMRIAPSVYYKRILQGVMTFLMAYTFACQMTLVLQCKNIAILWDNRVHTTCWGQSTLQGLSYANSTINFITDIFFALLPIPMLWKVKINARTKASLICVLGLVTCAAAIVKAVFISNYGKTGDFLWDSANLTIWIATETNTGIIAACLPCIKPMFKRMLDSSLRYESSNKKDAYHLRSYGHGHGHGTGPRGSMFSHSQNRPNTEPRSRPLPNNLDDNISEESILTQKHGGITKTTKITIDTGVDDRGSASGDAVGWQKDYPERVVEDRL
ncbi:hypothetical protein GGR53DRAFT_531481 [Hypoxylon sp. FL1150]|nr:hypothetical protein GGR53DRAFT_531481 [Hypoxylon sp. FL1150]